MKSKKIYNVIFPIWFLLLIPSMWLISLPANFIIDSIILLLALKYMKIEGSKEVYKKSIFKVFIFGFLADIIGSGILAIPMLIGASDTIITGINWDPYTNASSLVIIIIATILAGIIIYMLNRLYSFNLPHITETNKKRLATVIAIFTIPYFFFVPTKVLYENVTTYINKMQEQSSYKNIVTYDDYINTYKDIYLGNNSKMIELTQVAKNVVGKETFYDNIEDIKYEINTDTLKFCIDYKITGITNSQIEEYNKWSEKIALLIIKASVNTKQVEFNITSNNTTTVQTIYNQEYFEYKYSTPFESIINDTEYIRTIIQK